jgi:ribosomal protein S18 acetylase RimI-like enzyme
VDLIKDYPSPGVWTMGYFLVHPEFRRQLIGTSFLGYLQVRVKLEQGATLRCCVQEQNPGALKFWQWADFIIVDKIQSELGKKINPTFILERDLSIPNQPEDAEFWIPFSAG